MKGVGAGAGRAGLTVSSERFVETNEHSVCELTRNCSTWTLCPTRAAASTDQRNRGINRANTHFLSSGPPYYSRGLASRVVGAVCYTSKHRATNTLGNEKHSVKSLSLMSYIARAQIYSSAAARTGERTARSEGPTTPPPRPKRESSGAPASPRARLEAPCRARRPRAPRSEPSSRQN